MVVYKQDLPPKGGFSAIEWAKRPARYRMNGYTQFALFAGFTCAGWIWYAFFKRNYRKRELALKDARIAIEPFLLAERQRAYLALLRQNRDEENELMKNVKCWETGTLWGEPVFHNVRDRFKRPALDELITHMDARDRQSLMYDKFWR